MEIFALENNKEDHSRLLIQELHRQGDWRGILQLFDAGLHEPKLLWLRPTEDALQFIVRHVTSRGLRRVVSLGCGTGLFEWLLACAAPEVEVVGVEVDEAWWRSSYAPPTFLPLSYVDSAATQEAVTRCADTALLFCYFNCGPAWRSYLANFAGGLVIVCGPAEGSGTHSDPQPFQPLTPEWTIVDGHRVGRSKDHVAVYQRI